MTKLSNSRIFVGYGRQALQSNALLYPGAVPADDVREDLFGWTAQPAPLFASVDGRPIVVPGRVANVRSDNSAVLGIVSDSYAIHQYGDSLVDAVEKLTGRGAAYGTGLGISAAGINKNGAVGWVSVGMPNTITTPEGVEYLPNLIAYGSHDGSLVTGYKTSILNMTCNNQMGQMLAGGTAVRVKHTRNSVLRLENAQQALGIIAATAEEFSTAVRQLCREHVSDSQWDAIVDELCGPIPTDVGRGQTLANNKRDELNGLYRSDPRCSPWSGTAYGAVQTFNTYAQHVQSVRGAHRDERNLLSTLAGDWDTHDQRTHAAVRRVLTRTNV